MIGGGPFGLQPGQWTDDTSMALCLAESLTEKRSFDPADQMDRYCRWWQEGYLSSTGTCFDIGVTVRTSLESYLRSAGLLIGALQGRSKEDLLSSFFCPAPDRDYWHRYSLTPEIAE